MMNQRTLLLATGFDSTQLANIETDLALNLDSVYFTSYISKHYSFTTQISDYYSLISLPDNTSAIINGIYTYTKDLAYSILETVTLTEIDPIDTDQFYFTLFGNQIMVSSDGELKYIMVNIYDKSISTLDTEIQRFIYALLDHMNREDPDGIFYCLQELSNNFKNKISKNVVKAKKTKLRSGSVKVKAWPI